MKVIGLGLIELGLVWLGLVEVRVRLGLWLWLGLRLPPFRTSFYEFAPAHRKDNTKTRENEDMTKTKITISTSTSTTAKTKTRMHDKTRQDKTTQHCSTLDNTVPHTTQHKQGKKKQNGGPNFHYRDTFFLSCAHPL